MQYPHSPLQSGCQKLQRKRYTYYMTPYLQALRAITYTTLRAIVTPLAWIVGCVVGVSIVTTVLLAIIHSSWWLLGLIIFIPLGLVVAAAIVIILAMLSGLKPKGLSKEHQQQIRSFTDKITRIIEVRATPLPLIVFFIAKDVVRGKKSSYIEGLLNDSRDLKPGFDAIVGIFRNNP